MHAARWGRCTPRARNTRRSAAIEQPRPHCGRLQEMARRSARIYQARVHGRTEAAFAACHALHGPEHH